jgi:hypothetical protein
VTNLKDSRLISFLKSLKLIIKDEDKSLKKLLSDFPEVDDLIEFINGFEGDIYGEFKKEKNFIRKFFKKYKGPMDKLEKAFDKYIKKSEFSKALKQIAFGYFMDTSIFIADKVMFEIDKDIAFNTLSERTLDWIDEWSEELGEIMSLTTQDAVRKIIKDTLDNGWGIDKTIDLLEELPEFDRKRARATAITEVLTACTVGQHEAYLQSPSVTGKTWLHSGEKGIKPRENHKAIDGVTIRLDEKFDLGDELAKFPRDTALSAKERVFCHCVLAPSVDSEILGLSKEEKEALRSDALAGKKAHTLSPDLKARLQAKLNRQTPDGIKPEIIERKPEIK